MIFVTLGSQKFQFDRLLKAIDDLCADGIIKETVFAQTGYSTYLPMNYNYHPFIDRDVFEEKIEKCDIVITHGGTGAIMGALKRGKKVIAVPRLARFDEHVDDHQTQIVNSFDSANLICSCGEGTGWHRNGCVLEDELLKAIDYVRTHEFDIYTSNTDRIICCIRDYIEML